MSILYVFCGQRTSLLHLFITCQFATEILNWFVLQLRKFKSAVVLSDAEILFGFLPSSGVPVVSPALFGCPAPSCLVGSRNHHHFENIAPDSLATLKKPKSTFRFLVRMHKHHCSLALFVHEWLTDGVIGFITQQDWI